MMVLVLKNAYTVMVITEQTRELKTFFEGTDKFTNPSYIWDRMKRLKCRYNKAEREHEYKEELVTSAKKTFEKLCSRVDDPMQALAFSDNNKNFFLDTESTNSTSRFKNYRIQWSP
jgi:hypothetical protein